MNLEPGVYNCPNCGTAMKSPGPMELERDKLQAQVKRLHTWKGLISLLDKHWPEDVFDGASGDAGPRLIVALREIDRLEGDVAALQFMLNHEWQANNEAEPIPNWVPFARSMQEAAEKSPQPEGP